VLGQGLVTRRSRRASLGHQDLRSQVIPKE
jgi:hypothetical protein